MSGRGDGNDAGRGGAGGRGKGRKSKVKGRGSGNRRFVTSAEDLAQRDVIESQRQEARRVRRQDDDEEDDDKKGKDDDDDDEDGLTFEDANEEVEARVVKAKGVSGLISTQNPNAKSNATKNIKVGAMSTTFVEQKLSRREREAIEKAKSSAAYLKRHLAGETDQAKKDISRLAMVKKRRDDADKRRGEEEEAAQERGGKTKKVVKVNEEEALDVRTIKAMKPAVVKEKLKERDLSTQGQKKDLIQRLLDYENEKCL